MQAKLVNGRICLGRSYRRIALRMDWFVSSTRGYSLVQFRTSGAARVCSQLEESGGRGSHLATAIKSFTASLWHSILCSLSFVSPRLQYIPTLPLKLGRGQTYLQSQSPSEGRHQQIRKCLVENAMVYSFTCRLCRCCTIYGPPALPRGEPR